MSDRRFSEPDVRYDEERDLYYFGPQLILDPSLTVPSKWDVRAAIPWALDRLARTESQDLQDLQDG